MAHLPCGHEQARFTSIPQAGRRLTLPDPPHRLTWPNDGLFWAHPFWSSGSIRELRVKRVLVLFMCLAAVSACSKAKSTEAAATPAAEAAPEPPKPVPAQLPELLADVNGETVRAEVRLTHKMRLVLGEDELLVIDQADHMYFNGTPGLRDIGTVGRDHVDFAAVEQRGYKVIKAVSTAYWQAYLRDDAMAMRWLKDGSAAALAASDGVLRIK